MLRPSVGKRVRFNTWHRGGSEDRGPEDRSKFTGLVVDVRKEEGWKAQYVIKRDIDGNLQYCESSALIEYLD